MPSIPPDVLDRVKEAGRAHASMMPAPNMKLDIISEASVIVKEELRYQSLRDAAAAQKTTDIAQRSSLPAQHLI